MVQSNELTEMIYLTKRREILMTFEEHIIYEFLFHQRLLKLKQEERAIILKMRATLTKLLMEWDN